MQNHSSVLTKIALALALALPAFAIQPTPAPAAKPAAPATAPAAKPAPAPAAKSAAAPGAKGLLLDQKTIHDAYNEGDFEKVTKEIDAFNRSNKTYSRADSIFIAKHLAVVYSANPQSREKGRYFMYRLLEMMPSAELVDMFVSDEIDRIFEKVRKEFLTRQKGFGVDSTQISMPAKAAGSSSTSTASAQPANQGPSKEFIEASKNDKPSFWQSNGLLIAGGVGLVVAGTVAYFIATADEPATGHTITIPGETTASK